MIYPAGECTVCNKPYTPKPMSHRQRYCSRRCNQKDVLERARKRNSNLLDELRTACSKCGNPDKRVLDFHHLGNKSKTLSRLSTCSASIERILIEAKKCVVLCSNCHRILHWEERNAEPSNAV